MGEINSNFGRLGWSIIKISWMARIRSCTMIDIPIEENNKAPSGDKDGCYVALQ